MMFGNGRFFRRTLVVLFIVSTAMPVLPTGASSIVRFEDGSAEAVAGFVGPYNSTVVRFEVPAECHILNATVNVSAMAPNASCPGWPNGVQVILNDTVLWEFNGMDFGAMGMQDKFVKGMSLWKSGFNQGGGTNYTAIRLPKNAMVRNASMDVNCSGPWGMTPFRKFNGSAEKSYFGRSVSIVGHVNDDEYDDVVVGAPYDYGGSPYAGCVFVYYGGGDMDTTADMVFWGSAANDKFGYSVSGAGDVNNDGFDDIIVGAPSNDTGGPDVGRAYIFFGGPEMNSTADLVLTGTWGNEHFGYSVSAAGDVNGDGYDDVIVGAPMNNAGVFDAGRACIFFGGANMDSDPDVVLVGQNAWDESGSSVSSAGDVNNDGYDDVVVGAPFNPTGGNGSGRTFIYLGGANMDSTPDVILTGEASGDSFGCSVSGAGDINKDGYCDVIVGAKNNDARWPNTGRAYIFFGGLDMDSTADVIFTGDGAGDGFGASVSNAGDVNKDGYDDVIVGAPYNNAGGGEAGRAYAYFGGSKIDSIPDMVFTGGYGTYLGTSLSGGSDINEDGYDDIVVGGAPDSPYGQGTGIVYIFTGHVGILDPGIVMESGTWVMSSNGYVNDLNSTRDFSQGLTYFLSVAPPSGVDEYGNAYIDVGVRASAKSPGNISLGNLNITYDYNATVPDFAEGLNAFIAAHRSDKDATGNISVPMKVKSQAAGRVKLLDLWINADLAPIQLKSIPNVVMDEDTANSEVLDLSSYFNDDFDKSELLKFEIASVTNGSIAIVGLVDGRHLSVDSSSGTQNDNWSGVLEMVVNVSDSWGSKTVSNPFKVTVVNVPDPPAITSVPPLNATAGQGYAYQVTAQDGDCDSLTYSLVQKPQNMTINETDGNISWVPSAGGFYDVSIAVDDGIFKVYQLFTIEVANRPPRIINTTTPDAYVGVPYIYHTSATDDDGDALIYVLVKKPPGMMVDAYSGTIDWIPVSAGNFTVKLKVMDGSGGEATREIYVNVSERVKPKVDFITPAEGQKVKGKVSVTGGSARGTLDIVKIQLRVGSGKWVNTSGNSSWEFMLVTSKLGNGKHTLQARAFDGMDYSEAVNRTITVDNAKAGGKMLIPGFSGRITAVAMVMVLGWVLRKKRE
jgi:hypothetical protein